MIFTRTENVLDIFYLKERKFKKERRDKLEKTKYVKKENNQRNYKRSSEES